MQCTINNLTVECVTGDITAQPDIAAIANAANRQLKGGGGVDGAINRAAGPELIKASRALGPIEPGQAVITPAFELPNDRVIHCVGPVYAERVGVADELASCYRNALALAEAESMASIAFPAISAGVYGYPLDAAGAIAIGQAMAHADHAGSVTHIRFVLFDERACQAFDRALAEATAS
ncbi:RNase III inhibitor [Salinisphaera sp. USBA-960]|uniref:macro domain-containing protein n=1 Tax=Salinisphaera orenii TaxID=856731 RepID=UPI000DBE5E8F|nr:RNase III inhibitor [Salifodinibacter halophilus]NNC26720.1 RNase III inhibitor [Salifodinibacter halophilus]